jgi:NAD(P)-dependent dehydrogenase (short-subunit alcohol dehydrogenase family)
LREHYAPAFDFKDQIVLITGGSSGIGRAISHQFAADRAMMMMAARDSARGETTRRWNKMSASDFLSHYVWQLGAVTAPGVELRHGLDPALNGVATQAVAWAR